MNDQVIDFYRRDCCPGCASNDVEDIYRLPYADARLKEFIERFYRQRVDYQLLEDKDFQISKCSQCSLMFQRFVLNAAGQDALYGEWIDNRKSLQKKQQAKSKLFRQYAGQLEIVGRLISKPPHEIRILEFGMGWGYWSRMAAAFGYDVTGLELSPERVEHARKMGVKVIQELPEIGEVFDFIYANQVFEHLENPLRTLGELCDRLRTGGLIYLRVPDARGIKKRLTTEGWQPDMDAIHALEHINGFTRRSLCAMATKAGLTVVQPPVRIELSRFWSGLKREINDRWLTTHIYFRKMP